MLAVLGWCLVATALYVGYRSSLLGPALGVLLMGAALVALTLTVVRAARRRVHLRWLVDPTRPGQRRYAAQFVLRAALWLTAGCAAVLSFPRALAGSGEAQMSHLAIWASVLVLVVAGLAPARRVRWVTLVATGVGLVALSGQLVRIALPAPDPVVLAAPVDGTWIVGSGGRSGLLSHHFAVAQQRDALDLSVPFERHSGRPPTALADYPAYGRTVRAPADGVVVRAVESVPDQPVGQRNSAEPIGNHVVLDMGHGRYVLLAHLQPGSVAVTAGQPVRQGQPLAAVGSSGSSSEPHLHLQVQSGPDLLTPAGTPTPELVTFPVAFDGAVRDRAGATTQPAHDLRTNDQITFR